MDLVCRDREKEIQAKPKPLSARAQETIIKMAAASLLLLLLFSAEAWRPRPSLLSAHKRSKSMFSSDALRVRGGGDGPCIGIDLGQFDASLCL